MALRRWDPWSEMRALSRAMEDWLVEEAFRPFRRWFAESAVPVDVYHTPEAVVVKAVLPGVKPEDVEITITGNTLIIKGEAKAEREIKREDYIYQERYYGDFSRTLTLPSNLQTDKAEASFENGILTLTIPKVEEAKPKVIKLKVEK